jgi:hypothetical protein
MGEVFRARDTRLDRDVAPFSIAPAPTAAMVASWLFEEREFSF